MLALWVSLKENVNCGVKLIDVVKQQGKYGNANRELGPSMETPSPLVISRRIGNTQTLLQELDIGDPSRNIVEMIFWKAWMNTSKPKRKIKTVYRVSNSIEVLERFEKYRENVKKKAYGHYAMHPRSTVDGNELLRFYGTTMSCCQGKSKKVSELCKDPSCQVCRIIQSNFETESTKKNGIQLSTSSQELSDYTITTTEAKNMKRAVIICRAIAGSIIHVNGGEYGEKRHHFNYGNLVVRNPSAVLPCFVIVFS
ncbi:C2H2-like zinc finger protein [Quillaja saponaria]|uniref:C2H2-like zinc finger protein n=1 Tax=Quillaja saponaria TaxID=32244 RepID=A0AAD7PQ29_QUISA|nr:C2H2-like zinc finger protein [Quillaja saponaria]